MRNILCGVSVILFVSLACVGCISKEMAYPAEETIQRERVPTNIKDVLKVNGSYYCNVTIMGEKAGEERQARLWVKEENIRMEDTFEGNMIVFIRTRNASYVYDSVYKTGLKTRSRTLSEIEDGTGLTGIESEPEDKVNCAPAEVSDSMFEVPSDIQIKDTMEIFESVFNASIFDVNVA